MTWEGWKPKGASSAARSFLRPNDAAAAYEKAVLDVLGMLASGSNRWTAQAVLQRIAADPIKPIVISPYTAADAQRNGATNAYAEGIPVVESVPGLGSPVTLHYTPAMWNLPFAGGPDDVLLHELVHAMRQEQGVMLPLPTAGGNAGYDNDEEFLAILLTNIALSE